MDVDDESEDGLIDWSRDFVGQIERAPTEEEPGGARLLTRGVWQRTAEDEDGTTLFVASTDDEDRMGDVIRQDWRLANYRRNPVIFDNHNPLRVVGRAVSATVPKVGEDAGKLMIRVAWNDNSPSEAIRAVGHDHRNGFRHAGSVGFRTGKRTARNKLPPDHPAYKEPVKVETWWGGTIEVVGDYLEQNELLEFSSASIPANPNAVQRAYVQRTATIGAVGVVRSEGSDLLRLLDDEEYARALSAKLWPHYEPLCRALAMEQLRSPEARRVLRAILDAGPPPASEPITHPLAAYARALELLEST